jgi:hypothetical protein
MEVGPFVYFRLKYLFGISAGALHLPRKSTPMKEGIQKVNAPIVMLAALKRIVVLNSVNIPLFKSFWFLFCFA